MTSFGLPPIPNPPPGPQRSLPSADESGHIPFDPVNFDIRGSTAYWIYGKLTPTSIPLIVLHGGPGATHSGYKPFGLLWNDYEIPVILYDQIGCGESTRFRERKGDTKLWTPELFIAELDNLVAHFQSTYGIKAFDLAGHSWGGRLGPMFAIQTQHPALRKLIVGNVSTSLSSGHEERARRRETLPDEVKSVFRRAKEGAHVPEEELQAAVMYEFGLLMCRTRPWPAELMGTMKALKEDDTVYSTMYGFNATGSLATGPDDIIEKDLHKITAKTVPGGMLIVSGRYDAYTDENMMKWFTIPTCNTKWVRFGLSSHSLMLEEPEEYLRTLGHFLRKL